MLNNPWKELPTSGEYVLPVDKPFVLAHNENQRLGSKKGDTKGQHEGDDRVLQLHLPPVPHLGLFDAPVVLLLANPGFANTDAEYFQRVHHLSLESAQSETGTPVYPLLSGSDDARGEGWWRSRTKELGNEIGGFDELAHRLLVVELHGYHSRKWSAPLRNFPSQEFGFNLVRQAMDRKAIIIAARCQQHWFASVPGLRGYGNLVAELSSSRSVHLSRKNLGDKNFARVVAKLKQGHSTTL